MEETNRVYYETGDEENPKNDKWLEKQVIPNLLRTAGNLGEKCVVLRKLSVKTKTFDKGVWYSLCIADKNDNVLEQFDKYDPEYPDWKVIADISTQSNVVGKEFMYENL